MSQAAALFLSIAIEPAVAAALMRFWRRGDAARAALVAGSATAATHWAVWLSVPWLEDRLGYLPAVLLVEACVVAAEAVAYRLIVPLGLRRALAVSLMANAASVGAGWALYTPGLA